MINDINKERWLDEAMNSLKGMEKAHPGDHLFERLMEKIDQPISPQTIPFPFKQWAAAAIVLLALNLGAVMHFMHQDKRGPKPSGDNTLMIETQLESTYNY